VRQRLPSGGSSVSSPVRWVSAFLDNPRHSARADEAFWAHVTGWPESEDRVGDHGEFMALLPVDGHPYLWFQDVDGPAGVHPDLYVDDVSAEADRAVGLGALITHRWDDGLIVLRSPGGMPFCLVQHREQVTRPRPMGWPGGRSIVDQICLDIPCDLFDDEASFWASLTGWERFSEDGSEFERLARPEGMPVQFLLQRLEERDGATRAHLDLACEDREAESERHVTLGAEVVRRTPGWTTMRDPAGREYCLTRRDPTPGSTSQ
jgi:hypothetical protein